MRSSLRSPSVERSDEYGFVVDMKTSSALLTGPHLSGPFDLARKDRAPLMRLGQALYLPAVPPRTPGWPLTIRASDMPPIIVV